jgi:hypothetical protein
MMARRNRIRAMFTRENEMLWLIWIAIMLLTPVLAGIGVWWQTHARPIEAAPVETGAESQQGRSP